MASTEQLAGWRATSDDIGVRALASWFLAGTPATRWMVSPAAKATLLLCGT